MKQKEIYISANTLYQFHSINSENINVLDGNTNTYEESKYSQPYIRVHLKESKVISGLDITLQLGKYIFKGSFKYICKYLGIQSLMVTPISDYLPESPMV